MQGPVEPLHFAVLPWAVGFDSLVCGAEAMDDLCDGAGVGVGSVVVGHDPFDYLDAVVGEELGGSCDEPGAGVALFVVVDL